MKRTRLGILLLIGLAASPTAAATRSLPTSAAQTPAVLSGRQTPLWVSAVHASKFSPLAPPRTSCESAQPPEALATPDPLLAGPSQPTKLTVSFIVGTDGRVHSPLILHGLGPSADRVVLEVVSSWRYRPATCNGVPTEAEGKIAFSSR